MKRKQKKLIKVARKVTRLELTGLFQAGLEKVLADTGYDSKEAKKEIKKTANKLAKKLAQKVSSTKLLSTEKKKLQEKTAEASEMLNSEAALGSEQRTAEKAEIIKKRTRLVKPSEAITTSNNELPAREQESAVLSPED